MNDQRSETNAQALADLALRMVIKSKTGYRFQDDAAKGLGLALDEVFKDRRFDPKAQIEALVRLGLLFETRHQAPPIAETIYDVLAKDDRALQVLGVAAGAKSRALREGFARFVGETVERRAPVYGAAAPTGSLKASDFLDPAAPPVRSRRAPKSRAASPKIRSKRRPITLG